MNAEWKIVNIENKNIEFRRLIIEWKMNMNERLNENEWKYYWNSVIFEFPNKKYCIE